MTVLRDVRAEIDMLLADWAWYIDHDQIDEVLELFTEDAYLNAGGQELRGLPEITARLRRPRGTATARSTRHVYSGLRLTHVEQDSVSACATWTCYAASGPLPVDTVGVYLVSDFFDTYRRGPDGRWRISSRTISPVFREPALGPGKAA